MHSDSKKRRSFLNLKENLKEKEAGDE